ncbi:MAG: tRNA uridine-5-carboxymethylaminomethyl(34) synthesis enzyme MnmG [Nitrospirae bacterium]|nr:tRNA uridine-5-carboxymethylaminomethyl(34) synthesis enzyme MnmG [Nitrospirota bacterium]
MYTFDKEYDVIVVGAGHAGCEAALASARLGCKTLMFTINLDNIAQMSCNPAVGGIAKGHLVKEIDALGGEMGRNTDKAGIQFRMLNTRKGPAVRALRAQADRVLYRLEMRKTIEAQDNIDILQGMVTRVLEKNGKAIGVETVLGIRYLSKTMILTTGTFLKGLIHIGLKNFPAGRAGEFPSMELSDSLRELGFQIGRLKTGTPPRIDGRSIDFLKTIIQYGDEPSIPFSYSTEKIINPQLPCYLTYTNAETHKIIKDNLDRSPLYCGVIEGVGPRYCPSIEDKVVRFSEKERHQIFLEPEGLNTTEYYANGISTSLPADVQLKFIHTIEGLEKVKMVRPGYAIEYDFAPPTQLKPTLETKLIENLFNAGQINGTSGYEEAAAQGLIAGINAAAKIKGTEPLILSRSEAYIGVLIDDLIIKGTKEPYRMFTSRAEYRLLLRHDNADLRLREKGYKIGLVSSVEYDIFMKKSGAIKKETERLKTNRIKPTKEIKTRLENAGITDINAEATLSQLLKRPDIEYKKLIELFPSDEPLSEDVMEQVEIEIKYEGYIQRQLTEVERFKGLEEKRIPLNFDYDKIKGFSREVKEKLKDIRPVSIGQATRISGVTPAAVSILLVALEREYGQKK